MDRITLVRLGVVVRTLLITGYTLLFSLLMHLFFKQYWYIELFITTLFLSSMARVATLGDGSIRRAVIGMHGAHPKKHREMLSYLRHHSFSLLELATLLTVLFLLPIDFGVCAASTLFAGVPFYLLRRLLTSLVALPVATLACYIGRRSALFHLYTQKENRTDAGAAILHLASYLGYAALYLAGAYMAAQVIVTFAGFLALFIMLPALLGAALLVLGFIFLRRVVRVIRARRRLIHRMTAICKTHGYTCTPPRALYRSIFFGFEGFHFSLTVGKDIYDCRIYSDIRRSQNLFFYDDGYVTSVSAPKGGLLALMVPVRAANGVAIRSGAGIAAALSGEDVPALFSALYTVRKPYSFESENRKVLIVTPAVNRWYIAGNGLKQIDVGAWAYGYKIYNADTFLGLLEREAIADDFKKH